VPPDRFLLPPVARPIGDTILTHVMRLTAMGQSFIMTCIISMREAGLSIRDISQRVRCSVSSSYAASLDGPNLGEQT
jgi:hypothetical protein